MIPERWQEVSDLLHEAMQLAPEQRSVFLDRLDGGDPALRREVESLLEAHDQAGSSFLQDASPAAHEEAPAASVSMAGRRFGHYRIIALLGEGGMGEVYRAERDDDQFHKKVAIKLVQEGRDSASVLKRFRNERQILANLDHPNIAQLLDGGTTEDGFPFFVMELIEGESIDDHCERHQLSVEQRLELFLQVCSAVQFAHQRLVIHRDIKPGNILVTADGVPKLLDFGIAKILGEDGAERNDPTLTMFRALTPAYASPEQVRGEPITTASDVYSLGVVLYVLLTGRHPYRRQDSSPEEIAKAACQVEPAKPSTAVKKAQTVLASSTSNLAAEAEARHSDPLRKLSKRLRGDLDNIVLMALRKEPQRRYTSVEQFATDIRRHLDKLPVIARKDTARYRLSKFVARHKTAAAATVVVTLTLIAGFIVTLREARIAERRFNDVRSLANSLIFDVHDSIKDLPGSTPARKIIIDRALQYLNRLAQESGSDAGLQRELATAYERVGMVQGQYGEDNLGDAQGAVESYEKALELRKQIGARSRDWNDRFALAQSYRLAASMLSVTGRIREARENIDKAIALSQALNQTHPNDPRILNELGIEFDDSAGIVHPDDPNAKFRPMDEVHKALSYYEAALKLTPDDVPTLHLYASDMGGIGRYIVDTDPKGALSYYQKELEIEQSLTERSSGVKYASRVAHAYGEIMDAYEYMGDNARELENAEKALAIFEDLSRKDPKNASMEQHLAIGYINAALALARTGQVKRSIEDWTKGVELMRRLSASAPENKAQRHYLASSMGAGGIVFLRAHRPEDAIKQFDEARAVDQSLRDAGVATPFDVANMAECIEKMGEASAMEGNTNKAEKYFHEALAIAEPLLPASAQAPDFYHGELLAAYTAADAYSGLGDLSFRQANWQESRTFYGKSLETWHRIAHPNHTAGANSFDVGDPAEVEKKLHQCDAHLRRLH